MFKFSLGSFGAFPIFDDLVSGKQVVVECKGPKFQFQTKVFHATRLLFTVKCSRSVWGHSVQGPVFDDLVSSFDLNIQGSLYCHVLYLTGILLSRK